MKSILDLEIARIIDIIAKEGKDDIQFQRAAAAFYLDRHLLTNPAERDLSADLFHKQMDRMLKKHVKKNFEQFRKLAPVVSLHPGDDRVWPSRRDGIQRPDGPDAA